MQYIQLRRLLGDFTVFSLPDIRQAEPGFDRRRLSEWQEKGYIKKIIKGYYIFSDRHLDDMALFEISNRIYAPSYVSFESVLAYHGLIPESVYGITCASTRKTMSFKTPLGAFIYHTIRPKLYFGFEYTKCAGLRYCKVAFLEKALLDYFYLKPELNSADGFASLRINKEVFRKRVNADTLFSYAGLYGQKLLKKRISAFREYLLDARA